MAPRATLVIEPRTCDISVARAFAVRLAPLVLPERELGPVDTDALALMVSELVGNAVEHGEGAVQVSVGRVEDRVRVEITDGGEGVPRRRYAMPDALSGRGLGIVERLSTDWGWEARPSTGTVVWFEY